QCHVAAVDLEQAVRTQSDLEVQVACGSAAHAGTALAGQPNALALRYAARDVDLERARLDDYATGLVELRRLELDGFRAAVIRVLQVDLDAGHVILTAYRKSAARAPAALAEGAARAEQRGEEDR